MGNDSKAVAVTLDVCDGEGDKEVVAELEAVRELSEERLGDKDVNVEPDILDDAVPLPTLRVPDTVAVDEIDAEFESAAEGDEEAEALRELFGVSDVDAVLVSRGDTLVVALKVGTVDAEAERDGEADVEGVRVDEAEDEEVRELRGETDDDGELLPPSLLADGDPVKRNDAEAHALACELFELTGVAVGLADVLLRGPEALGEAENEVDILDVLDTELLREGSPTLEEGLTVTARTELVGFALEGDSAVDFVREGTSLDEIELTALTVGELLTRAEAELVRDAIGELLTHAEAELVRDAVAHALTDGEAFIVLEAEGDRVALGDLELDPLKLGEADEVTVTDDEPISAEKDARLAEGVFVAATLSVGIGDSLDVVDPVLDMTIDALCLPLGVDVPLAHAVRVTPLNDEVGDEESDLVDVCVNVRKADRVALGEAVASVDGVAAVEGLRTSDAETRGESDAPPFGEPDALTVALTDTLALPEAESDTLVVADNVPTTTETVGVSKVDDDSETNAVALTDSFNDAVGL